MIIAAFLGSLLFGFVTSYFEQTSKEHEIIEWVMK